VVLVGPRQIGKTTLARLTADRFGAGAFYLDLERPADRRRMEDPDSFLRQQAPKLVVLDEVHRLPALFEVLRGVIDDNRAAGFSTAQFLLLGSASLDLIASASESLAGRVAHLELTGVNADEAAESGLTADQLWLRGGFPESLLAADDLSSAQWREDFLRSYLERDIPMFAPRIPAETLRRLWTMLAHTSGGRCASTPYHHRTASGDELDLLFVRGGRPDVAIEVKRSASAKLGPGFFRACVHGDATQAPYLGGDATTVISVTDLVTRLRNS
jgi:uncharacterized protein